MLYYTTYVYINRSDPRISRYLRTSEAEGQLLGRGGEPITVICAPHLLAPVVISTDAWIFHLIDISFSGPGLMPLVIWTLASTMLRLIWRKLRSNYNTGMGATLYATKKFGAEMVTLS